MERNYSKQEQRMNITVISSTVIKYFQYNGY